jgi:uncharacterized protein (TIGR03437 family)
VDAGGKVYFVEGQSIRTLSPSTTYTPPVPSIGPSGVSNSASLAPAPVAPGSIATVLGSFGFGSPAQASGNPLPTALAGLSIQLQSGGGISAPLLYVSSAQVNLQVPWEVAGPSSVSVSPILNGTKGPAQLLKLAPFAPGIFAMNGQGTGQGAVVDLSYRLVDVSNPTTAGSVIQIYCTGLGAVTSPPPTGSPASLTTLSPTTTKATAKIGGLDAPVQFSGLAPGTVGEYVVNVQVPSGVTTGFAVPVEVSIGGVTSNAVTVAVQ